MTNDDRADAATSILNIFGAGEDETDAVDIIANLLHLSARECWDYTPADLCRIALYHFTSENS